jgi:hypothetical protein
MYITLHVATQDGSQDDVGGILFTTAVASNRQHKLDETAKMLLMIYTVYHFWIFPIVILWSFQSEWLSSKNNNFLKVIYTGSC